MNTTGIIVATTTGDIQTYQQTVGECVKSTSRFWETIYTNICTGQITSVPYGFWDLFVYSAVGLISLALLIFLIKSLIL